MDYNLKNNKFLVKLKWKRKDEGEEEGEYTSNGLYFKLVLFGVVASVV